MDTKIRKGDRVAVIAGREKGKHGEVLRVLRARGRVVVGGVNLVKRHVKPSAKEPRGGIVPREAALHLSNVMLIDPSDGRPCRVRIVSGEGGKRRVSVRTGTEILPR
jgi:large subunit ribosomal protein L24